MRIHPYLIEILKDLVPGFYKPYQKDITILNGLNYNCRNSLKIDRNRLDSILRSSSRIESQVFEIPPTTGFLQSHNYGIDSESRHSDKYSEAKLPVSEEAPGLEKRPQK
ncbi:hypothetical protein [Methanosarcina sp. UBA5]|uniref:hypothetical protein n=1 Tax=Methanosarcina sp. UBA5 TaxID=1915593 RepID=UPI0025D32739|nr:hypothetical protein [Methanosarcina sp. UBA5]